MTAPTYAQLSDPTQGGPGFPPEQWASRVLTILAMMASGQNPDGTPLPPTGSIAYFPANNAGMTTVIQTPDEVSGSGSATILELAADQTLFALKLAGAAYPTWLWTSDATDGFYAGDGTFDPYTHGANIFVPSGGGLQIAIPQNGFSLQATGGVTLSNNGSATFQINQTNASGELAISDNSSGGILLAQTGTGGISIFAGTVTGGTAGAGNIQILGHNTVSLASSTGSLEFFQFGSGAAQQTVTGSRGSNAALTSLLTALAAYGLIVNSTTT